MPMSASMPRRATSAPSSARAVDFYSVHLSLLQGDRLVPIDKPLDAKLEFHRDLVLIELRSDWTLGRQTWPKGSLLVAEAAAYLKGERHLTALFTPTPTRSLADYTATRSAVLLDVLDDVASRVEEWTRPHGSWQRRDVSAPYPGKISVTALHDPLLPADPLAEDYLLNAADFLSPDSLQLGHTGSDAREPLKSRPTLLRRRRHARRAALCAQRRTAPACPTSWSGRKGAKADGNNPTLLYGYGGFEVSMTPVLLRRDRSRVDRPRRRLRARQHPRRRRVRSRLAPGGDAGDTSRRATTTSSPWPRT